MWTLRNETPYAAARGWGRDRDGVHEWLVAVKAVFEFDLDGTLRPAREQIAPTLLPEYTGEPGASSLRYDTDLVPPKPTTDVLVNGTAHAPGQRPSKAFEVGFSVGPLRKTLLVRGDRRAEAGLLGRVMAQTEPLGRVPIVYERAYGGHDTSDPDPARQRRDARNPVGCGLAKQAGHGMPQRLPNFEYPGRAVDKAGPAGFGAIDSFWAPRCTWGGTYDDVWRKERFPLLPIDWDPRSLLCSPEDQRPPVHLQGGEIVELYNLTPQGHLRFVLPRVNLRFATRIDRRTELHHGSLGTVIIEPDDLRVILVWQTRLACPCDGDYLDVTTVREFA